LLTKYENPGNNYADILESYLIPAEEGFLFTQITEENINKLGEKRTLIVFTTDDSLNFGGINPKKYMNKYHFSKVIDFPLFKYLLFRIEITDKCPHIDSDLKNLLDDPKNVSVSDDAKMGDVVYDILTTCDKYSKLKNTLVVAHLSDVMSFSYKCMREYPIIITQVSMVKSTMNRLAGNSTMNIKQIRNMYRNFEVFDKNIPKSLYIKNMKFDLFHISPNPNIKELTPRITDKPLDFENVIIKRISTAPSVDACFRAIGLNGIGREKDKKRTYYVYRIVVDKNTRIVKPTTNMVPDQSYTNEYWILDTVPVEMIGSIIVSIDKNNNFIFDTSNMPEDPLITTKHKYRSKNKEIPNGISLLILRV